ncbi:MAG: hypothetical protein MRY20_00365 [Pelagibacteraceae bacterium]|nr:hypothetical protein [Pelagibacteraceae bacterium]
MKVNVSGVSMSIDTGDIAVIIDSFLETLRKELIKIAGDDVTTLKENINLLKQREYIVKSKTPEEWDDQILEWWLDLADQKPGVSGSKLCEMVAKTDDFLFMWNGTILPRKKDKHQDPIKFIMNSINRSRGSIKIRN